jgi:Nucleotide-diphospho-sugar transferase
MMTCWLCISFIITFGVTPLICAKKLDAMKERWTLKAAATRDAFRRQQVIKKLKRASGVYAGNKRKMQDLDQTVILNVVSYSGDDHSSYKQHLQNWFCYMRHWKYKPVVYTVSQYNSTSAEIAYEDETLNSWCPSCEIISYPNSLFWGLVAAKKRPMRRGSMYGDYEGNVPSFKHFGALVMLVPILEVIELGYNVLFFDIDVTLLRDPVPYMLRSTADISVSPESRDCRFPSHPSFREKTDWYKSEANTGKVKVDCILNLRCYQSNPWHSFNLIILP